MLGITDPDPRDSFIALFWFVLVLGVIFALIRSACMHKFVWQDVQGKYHLIKASSRVKALEKVVNSHINDGMTTIVIKDIQLHEIED